MQSRVLSEMIHNIMPNAAVRVRNGVTETGEERINTITLRILAAYGSVQGLQVILHSVERDKQ